MFWLIFQVPIYKEPNLTIPGTPAIVQHEILNNRRHVLTKVFFSVELVCCHDKDHGNLNLYQFHSFYSIECCS